VVVSCLPDDSGSENGYYIKKQNQPGGECSPVLTTQNYSRPLAIVTTLFFMWGFLTYLNDILVPHRVDL
jgi:hypothetical protein